MGTTYHKDPKSCWQLTKVSFINEFLKKIKDDVTEKSNEGEGDPGKAGKVTKW